MATVYSICLAAVVRQWKYEKKKTVVSARATTIYLHVPCKHYQLDTTLSWNCKQNRVFGVLAAVNSALSHKRNAHTHTGTTFESVARTEKCQMCRQREEREREGEGEQERSQQQETYETKRNMGRRCNSTKKKMLNEPIALNRNFVKSFDAINHYYDTDYYPICICSIKYNWKSIICIFKFVASGLFYLDVSTFFEWIVAYSPLDDPDSTLLGFIRNHLDNKYGRQPMACPSNLFIYHFKC